MTVLLQPFTFKYLDDPGMKILEFVPEEDLIPVSRLVSCLSMDWRGNRDKLKIFKSFRFLKFSDNRRQEAALSVEDFIKWLLGVNLLRVKKPKLVEHFQQHFPLAWEAYKDLVNNPLPITDVIDERAASDTEYAELLDTMEININKPLSLTDRYIAFLARFKGMTPEALRDYRGRGEVEIYREVAKDVQGIVGQTHYSYPHSFKSELGALKYHISRGWLPSYIFFLEYPDYHDGTPVMQSVLKQKEDGTYFQNPEMVAIFPTQTVEYQRKVERRKKENRIYLLEAYKKEVLAGGDRDPSEIEIPRWDFTGLGQHQKTDIDPHYGTARAWEP